MEASKKKQTWHGQLYNRFVAGDSRIELCECGKLFLNEMYSHSIYNHGWITFDKCRDCRKVKKVRSRPDPTP